MTATVVDASVAVAWLLASQANPRANAFLAANADMAFTAPFIFEWEVKNVILTLGRAGRIGVNERTALVARLGDFKIELQAPTDASAVLPLAGRERLSLFDAAYLGAALDGQAPLASRDRPLLTAAARNGVHVFDLSGEAT